MGHWERGRLARIELMIGQTTGETRALPVVISRFV
jgi:hypothetical protein